MSHRLGTVIPMGPITIGPDSGTAATSPNTWAFGLSPAAAPAGTKFVILHFSGAAFPAANRLEVDLGYDMDVFNAADGPDLWTRPINVPASGTVTIRYITNGSSAGHVVLGEYGRGEPMESVNTTSPSLHNFTNPDLFFLNSPYVEPLYEQRGMCQPPTANWENIARVAGGDVRAQVARSVCLFVHVEINDDTHLPDLSSCSGTLIGPDLVLCAGHCVSDANDLDGRSGSVTFDFQTDQNGNRPAGYSPKFYKVNKTIRAKSTVGGLDYSLLQLKTPVPGVPVVPLRTDLPVVNDEVFLIHHPQALPKKVSPRHTAQVRISDIRPGYDGITKYLFASCDLTGGSSGSELFDMSGRIIGIADISGGCRNGFLSVTEVLKDLAATPPSTIKRDVMLVIDRSGSMAMDAGTGRSKMDEARDAASLFVQLIRLNAGDQIGLASFSTGPTLDEGLGLVDGGKKNVLIGGPPFGAGKVGALIPDGLTSIGGGLQKANGEFPAAGPGVNKKTILLLTDGLQNTPPMVADVNPSLAGADISIIGLGTESSLDGLLLDRLAQQHNGMYTRAGSGLQLKKFFVLAFGNIFEAGTLSDPEYDLPGTEKQKSIPFRVCGEDVITAVLGWDRADVSLMIELHTPSGTVINNGTPGVESSSGRSWMFLRVPLPIAGERSGTWQAVVFRPSEGEFPAPAIDVRFFVNVVVRGGPTLVRLSSDRRYYTGDPFNPLVTLRNANRSTPRGATVKLTVTGPALSLGNLLSGTKLDPSVVKNGDVIPARQATLQRVEKDSGRPAVTYSTQTVDLFDDGEHDDGALEPDGIFGDVFPDLLKTEGTYTFHAVATYGDTCVSTRETIWSLHVDVGVDPGKSGVDVNLDAPGTGGTSTGVVVLTPKDVYGNNLGPGRGDAIVVTGAPGTVVTGPVIDNGDGTYTVPISWDPSSGYDPGVVIGQPGRPPTVVGLTQPSKKSNCWKWKLLTWLLLLLVLILLLVLLLT